MDARELQNIAFNNRRVKNIFAGVFAADELAKLPKIDRQQLPCAFIINLCNSKIVNNPVSLDSCFYDKRKAIGIYG